MSWWIYLILGIVLVAIGVILYIFYVGYNKIKPQPLDKIPCPPFSHPMLGHPNQMLHPLKHEYRREMSEAARVDYFQLVVMKQPSIFVNSPEEAARLLREVKSKGRVYAPFRYDQNIPDILSCDGDAYERRSVALGPALRALTLPKDSSIFNNLLEILNIHAETGKDLDIKSLYSLLAMDCVCEAAYNYEMNSLGTLLEHLKKNGEAGQEISDGRKLLNVLKTFGDVQAGSGIYANPNARKVPADELAAAKAEWKKFLVKIMRHIQTETEAYKLANGSLDRTNTNWGQALIEMISSTTGEYVEPVMIAEIHQVFRHGFETLYATLLWLTYALFKNSKVRENVEKSIEEHSHENTYPEYLEAVVKELLRRYPVAGNLTARTAHQEEEYYFSDGATSAPVGVPLHVHIYSHQTTSKLWAKALEFVPERWLQPAAGIVTDKKKLGSNISYPACPFLKRATQGQDIDDVDSIYEGAGFTADSLSYLPFSAGERSCKGKYFALEVIRKFLLVVSRNYRLNPVKSLTEEDPGISYFYIIEPIATESINISVQKITSLSELVSKRGGLVGGKPEDDGWAEDDQEE